MTVLRPARRMLLEPGSPEGRSLLRGLQATWTLEDAAGNPTDKSGNGNTLTNNAGVTRVAGPSSKIPYAAQMTAASLQYYSRADNAFLSMGDIDCIFSFWVYFDTLEGATRNYGLLGQYGAAGNLGYLIYLNSLNNIALAISGDGTAATFLANPLSLSTARWYYVQGWHDSVKDQIGLSVNNGTPVTASHTSGIFNSTAPFNIGNWNSGGQYHNGRIAAPMVLKHNPILGQASYLYNTGQGRSFSPTRGYF